MGPRLLCPPRQARPTFQVRHFFCSLRCPSSTASSCSFRMLRAFRVDRPRAKGGSPCREARSAQHAPEATPFPGPVSLLLNPSLGV